MELVVITKGNKYMVQDKKERLLYTVKKKGFGAGRYVLLDASNYNLYTLLQTGEDRKPTFAIILNDRTFMEISCKSLFLDPTLNCKGKDDNNYDLVSKDRREFTIVKGESEEIGDIKTRTAAGGDLQYDITIDDKMFDDYIPLFAVIIDKTFGDMNKQT